MMAKLLIPLDGSDFSRSILPHVRTTLTPEHYHVTLLHVANPPRTDTLPIPIEYAGEAFPPPSSIEEEQNLALSLEAEMLEDARSLEAAGFTVERAVRFGKPAREILAFVEMEGVALIAMATHGRTGLARLLMGSVAETLVRQVSVPILLVHPVTVASPEATELA